MNTRRTSPKDSQPTKPDEKPFLDLAAINEKILGDAARKIVEDLEREGKLPPLAKRDPKKDEEYKRTLTRLFGKPVAEKR